MRGRKGCFCWLLAGIVAGVGSLPYVSLLANDTDVTNEKWAGYASDPGSNSTKFY